VGYPYAVQPPEINSGMIWTGVGSGPLAASAAAWQELAAQLGSSGAAFSAVVESLAAGPWLGPSSMSMALSAAPFVVWMIATAMQCEQAAASAAHAAMVFEAAHAGVVPPPEIAENRTTLATLVATNFMGCNAGPIAANQGDYMRMWGQDASALQLYSADAAMVTGSLVPFITPAPTTNPAGLAAQAASVGQAAGTGAGNTVQNMAGAATQTTLPAGMDSASMLSMGPQLIGTIPSVLQGLAQPLSGGGLTSPLQSLGGFQSLLSPFMSAFSNPGMFGASAGAAGAIPAAAGPAAGAGLGGVGGLGGGVSAAVGRGGSLGGLSVPATWAASSQTGGAGGQPGVVNASAAAAETAAPSTASGAGMGGAAPMAAMGGLGGGAAGGPKYGTPIRVLPRQR
jgi:PPE-repeat protein